MKSKDLPKPPASLKLPNIEKLQKLYSFSPVADRALLLAADSFIGRYPMTNTSSMMKIFAAVDQMTKPYKSAEKILSSVSDFLKNTPDFNQDWVEKLTDFSRMNSTIHDQLRLSQTYNSFVERERKYGFTFSIPIPEFDPELLRSIDYSLIQEDGENDEGGAQIILMDESLRIKRIIKSIYRDHQELYRLDPRDFEEMIAELLRKQDYHVELTKQTRDGGYDLIAVQNLKDIPLRFLVECKRYASHRKIGVDIIRSFSDVMHTSGAMGMICTSSYFSSDAINYKKQYKPYLLHLRDHDDIVSWVNQYIIPYP